MTPAADETVRELNPLIQIQLTKLPGAAQVEVLLALIERMTRLVEERVTTITAKVPSDLQERYRLFLSLGGNDEWQGTYMTMVEYMLNDVLSDGAPIPDVCICAYEDGALPDDLMRWYQGTVVKVTPGTIYFADDVTVDTENVRQVAI